MVKDTFFSKDGWPSRLTPFSVVADSLWDLMVVSTMLNLLALVLPLTLLQVYDRILQNESGSTLSLLLLGVSIALIVEAVLKMGRSYIGAWLGARFEHNASVSAMERLMTINLADFERAGSGVHLERLNALNVIKDFYSGSAVLVILDLPFVPIFLLMIYHLAGYLVLIPVVVFVIFMLFTLYIGKLLHHGVTERVKADDIRINFIIEVLNGIHAVKSMAMEAMMLRRYERLQESCAQSALQVGMQSADAQNIGAFFAQLTTVAVVAFGSIQVISHDLTIGGLSACSMLAGRSIQPLQRAVAIWARFQTIRVARKRLNAIFELKPDVPPDTPPFPEVHGKLVMENVSFAYPVEPGEFRGGDKAQAPKEVLVIRDVNLEVKPGETIAIQGASGKTTLLWLMMGAIRPTRGRVLIDDHDLAKYDPCSLHSQVAYMPQTGMLFKGTILENIHMFRPEREGAAMDAANRLHLEDFISKLPKGYETIIDDGADETIPRGIKQRITIARALVSSPRIVLFDEANTAIDSSGDEKLKSVLEAMHGKVTLIMVTHRPSLEKLADRVYELKDGTLTLKPPKAPFVPRPAATPVMMDARRH
ncbi:MAG: ATP-binding cassette domain-containing protein [Magnetococcales bacterium]|nr:ATP-binding cassette domain-containing protein [Magnetococcales bacterium]